MNIFELGRLYIDSIPEGNENLDYDAIVPMITLQNGEVLSIRYRGYRGLMARRQL